MPFYQKQSQISELHLEYDHIITFPLCVSSKKHKSSNREKRVTQTIKGLWVSSLVFPCTFSTFSSPCLGTSSTNNLRGKRDGLFSTCMYMHIIYSHSQNQISIIINCYHVAEDLGGPLHQEQCLVHNARHFAMELILCLQYIHGALWHLCKQSYQTEVPPVGVACVVQDTFRTQLQMYHFLPELNQ